MVRKTKSTEPSLRDKLSATLLEALEADFRVHGAMTPLQPSSRQRTTARRSNRPGSASLRAMPMTARVTSMKSPVVKRSIVIAGHKTSVSLEDAFWKGLKEIAGKRDMTLSELVAAIDSERQHGNLRRPFACSCSTPIATSFPNQRWGTTERTR
jgi:predicted DNA-binding ribbon-helix-helix protein